MLGDRIARGIGWMFGGRIVGNGMGLVSTLIIAALLIPDDFGVFALATSIVTVVVAMFQLQTETVIIQMPDPQKQDFDTVFTLNLLRGLLLGGLLCAMAWPLSVWLNEPRLSGLMMVLSLQPVLLGFRNPYFERYAKEVKFAPTTLVDILTKLATFIGSVGFALIYPTYWALASGVLAAAFVQSLSTFLIARERPGLSLASFRHIFSYSIWLGLSSLVREIGKSSGQLILGIGFSVTTLGFYSLAWRIISQIMQALIQPLNWAFFSGLSQRNQDIDALRASYVKAYATMAAVLLPAATGLFLVSEPFILTLFGHKWADSVLDAKFTAVIFFLTALVGPFWALAMSLGATKILFLRTAIGAATSVSFQTFGILYYGVPGFLIGGIASTAINTMIAMEIARRLIGVSILGQFQIVMRPVFASFAMAPPIMFAHTALAGAVPGIVNLALQVTLGGVVYGLVTLVLWMGAGYPDGPERYGSDLLKRLYLKVQNARANDGPA